MNKESLESSLDDLISSLCGNQTAESYYKKVRDKLAAMDDGNELKIFLDAICGSAKAKDVYGLTLEQCAAWDKMWDVADKLRAICME
jgi:hypothetical protein